MSVTIRKATKEDAEHACGVLHRSIRECCSEDHNDDPAIIAAWLTNKTPDSLRLWFQSRGYPVVAEKDGLVVGTAMLTAEGTVALCYVLAEVRYSGIGKAMLLALEAEAKSRRMNAVERKRQLEPSLGGEAGDR